MDTRLSKISRTIIAGLRHKPESVFKHNLDKQGYISIDVVLSTMAISREELDQIVRENDKNRFEVHGDNIRARQGHTLVQVEIEYKRATPPIALYHGTTESAIEGIAKKGILKMDRHHVHLTADLGIAKNVGNRRVKRHNKLAIMTINAKQMVKDGIKFYLTENDVWLTDSVAPKYITLTEIF